ncbi:MAG: M20/M25/M40 family metallo-hydrolase [Firmicutes bacterium]|nr:M20/M25/M40 family metallo-hydrolase [Bacillota bacterium]
MNKNIYMRYFLVLIAVVIGLTVLSTPKEKEITSSSFSALRAYEDILVISEAPHTVENHTDLQDVRDYLLSRMNELDLNPVQTTYAVSNDSYNMTEVNNILGVIEGVNDSYILLVAHYDSSPAKRVGELSGSKGAADDGYGLSSILEVIKVLQDSNVVFNNGIKILFTDAEEVGALGATAEIEHNPSFFDNVAYVINVEARGVKGPNIMFQTSLDNYRVLKLYREAFMPVSFSLAGDVYSKMPNFTDFTPLLELDLNGINMAVLDNLDYYHTPLDNAENVSLTSLQHYGEIITPIVKEFVTNEIYSDVHYFETNQNAVYFTFLPNVFLLYTTSLQFILFLMTISLFLVIGYVMIKNHHLKLKDILISTATWLGISVILMVVGILISKTIGFLVDIPFNLTYMPKVPANLFIFSVISVFAIAIVSYFVHRQVKKKNNAATLLLSGILVNIMFMSIFEFVLEGGVYLFMLPSLIFFVLNLIVFGLEKSKVNKPSLFKSIRSINIVFPIILFAPIVYLLFLALTIGALGVCLFFISFPLMIVIPQIYALEN